MLTPWPNPDPHKPPTPPIWPKHLREFYNISIPSNETSEEVTLDTPVVSGVYPSFIPQVDELIDCGGSRFTFSTLSERL